MFNAPADRSKSAFPVLSSFFAFWEEVEALRRDVRPERDADAVLPRGSASGRAQLAEALRKERAEIAHSAYSAMLPQFDEAQYVMAATADELFIGLNWEGADRWRLYPLEAELFGTRRAGQEIFARLERLIDGSNPFNTEMAAVYLTALELGFKGTFADADDTQTLERYETELRKMVGRSESTRVRLVPQCYENTIVGSSDLRMPASRGWWWTACGIVGICLVTVVMVAATRFRGTSLEQARQKLEASFGLVAARR